MDVDIQPLILLIRIIRSPTVQERIAATTEKLRSLRSIEVPKDFEINFLHNPELFRDEKYNSITIPLFQQLLRLKAVRQSALEYAMRDNAQTLRMIHYFVTNDASDLKPEDLPYWIAESLNRLVLYMRRIQSELVQQYIITLTKNLCTVDPINIEVTREFETTLLHNPELFRDEKYNPITIPLFQQLLRLNVVPLRMLEYAMRTNPQALRVFAYTVTKDPSQLLLEDRPYWLPETIEIFSDTQLPTELQYEIFRRM